jgi:hypothetical protein
VLADVSDAVNALPKPKLSDGATAKERKSGGERMIVAESGWREETAAAGVAENFADLESCRDQKAPD